MTIQIKIDRGRYASLRENYLSADGKWKTRTVKYFPKEDVEIDKRRRYFIRDREKNIIYAGNEKLSSHFIKRSGIRKRKPIHRYLLRPLYETIQLIAYTKAKNNVEKELFYLELLYREDPNVDPVLLYNDYVINDKGIAIKRQYTTHTFLDGKQNLVIITLLHGDHDPFELITSAEKILRKKEEA